MSSTNFTSDIASGNPPSVVREDGELSREATTEESLVVPTEGGRDVQRPLMLYNLVAILAVGYRAAPAAWRWLRSPRTIST